MASLKKGKKALIDSGAVINSDTLSKIPLAQLEGLVLKDPQISQQVHETLERYRDQRELCRLAFEQQVSRYEKGDDLSPGVIKMVKVYVTETRVLCLEFYRWRICPISKTADRSTWCSIRWVCLHE